MSHFEAGMQMSRLHDMFSCRRHPSVLSLSVVYSVAGATLIRHDLPIKVEYDLTRAYCC